MLHDSDALLTLKDSNALNKLEQCIILKSKRKCANCLQFRKHLIGLSKDMTMNLMMLDLLIPKMHEN